MDFINNWQTALTDPLPATAGVPLPVPPDQRARLAGGDYLLTLTDGEAIEIIRYDGAAGLVAERGLEGTQPQAWPVDTVIYAAVTAGQLTAIMATLGSLQQQIDSLQQQIDACCSGGSPGGLWSGAITVGSDLSQSPDWIEYGMSNGYGDIDISPDAPEVQQIRWMALSGEFAPEEGGVGRYLNITLVEREGSAAVDFSSIARVRVKLGDINVVAEADQSTDEWAAASADLTSEQFDALPKSGTHSFEVEIFYG